MAASTAKAGYGTLFQMQIPATATTYTTIAEITSISGPSLSKEMIDVTHMTSPGIQGAEGSATNAVAREYVGSVVDGGEVSLDLNFLPSGATHQALYEQGFKTNAADGFRIIWAGDDTTTPTYGWTFDGIVSAFAPTAPVDGKQGLSVTIKVTANLVLP